MMRKARTTAGYWFFRRIMEGLLEIILCFMFVTTTVITVSGISIIVGEAFNPDIPDNLVILGIFLVNLLLCCFIVYLEIEIFEMKRKFMKTQSELLVLTNSVICVYGIWFSNMYEDFGVRFMLKYPYLKAFAIDIVIGNAMCMICTVFLYTIRRRRY